jgi:hypothetical protein
MKAVRIVSIVFACYLVIALILDGAIGYFQPRPQGGATVVLRTYDDLGRPHDTVLAVLDDNGQLWLESGHWFRGWYHRAVKHPDVDLTRGGVPRPYRAVPVDTPEAHDTVTRLMGKGMGMSEDVRYWIGRAVLLFAPIKPLRLDPRPPEGDAR